MPESVFPPEDIRGFLAFCAGEWMALRSRFVLDPAAAESLPSVGGEAGENGDEWHSSERGELHVAYEPTGDDTHPGDLVVTPPGGPPQRLSFLGEGSFRSGERQGYWQLWPDGSLELRLESGVAADRVEVRERIWFTKPNLRLRSSVEHRHDGTPGRASFSSEIRRVSRPATPAPQT